MFPSTFFTGLLSVCTLADLSRGASASAFLRSRTPGELQKTTRELIEGTLRAELLTDPVRLEHFERELQPMYLALPKNEHGTLEPVTVRYALHRYFVQTHGWYVKGLEPAGQAWNGSAPSSIMKDRVPTYIQGLFEQRLQGQGVGLHDLAVFAATLLDFVHNEALTDVLELYKALGMSTTSPATQGQVEEVIKAYMLQTIDLDNPIESRANMHETESHMIDDFPAWGDLQLWVDDSRRTIALERAGRSFGAAKGEALTLASVVQEVQELNDRLGAFQDLECRSLKAGLAELEYKSTGRVLLSDFYAAGMEGIFLFNEHVDFLRKLGVLDESDSRHPSVIISNYLASQANCLAATGFHSVCCIDECEGLLGHLERAIAEPTAAPARIAEVVAGLRSDTVDAPRNLSSALLSRLGEIAEHHGGQVPLHGRLFAQWMHHAYPLECPYPHAAGTVRPLTPDEWMEQTGKSQVQASNMERRVYLQQAEEAAQVAAQASADSLPWTRLEELVVTHNQASRKGSLIFRKAAAFLAVIALAVPIAGASSAFLSSSKVVQAEKQHMV